jgi:DNA primase
MKVDVLKILDDLGIEYKPSGSKDVKIRCINPNHEDKTPSLSIDKELGIFQCWSCHIKGNIFTIVNIKRGHSNYLEFLGYISKFVVGGLTEDEKQQTLKDFLYIRSNILKKDIIYKDIELPKHKKISKHPYLTTRGITEEEAVFWNMGVVEDNSKEYRMYNGWILIPIVQNGITRSYFLRNPWRNAKIYGVYPRSDILFGIDSAGNTDKKIYLVEGIFDMIFFRRTRQQCVATLSNRILPDQKKILKKYKKVVIVPDNDAPGEILVKSAEEKLVYSTEVFVCRLPQHKKDAAECSLEELVAATYKEIPLNDYIINSFMSRSFA